MARHVEYLVFFLAALSVVSAVILRQLPPLGPTLNDLPINRIASVILLMTAVILLSYGLFHLTTRAILRFAPSKRRAHTTRNVLRLLFSLIALIGVLAVATEQWLGLLFSLGILGFAVTFALQQPLLSVLGWFYIIVKHPYRVGDRVKIDDAKGDVIDVDFLVTTIWEINGELVSTNQPSGRIVTVPNSVVLSREVYNYSWEEFPFIWNELSIQLAYETDLDFARASMQTIADDFLGDEMEARVERYRRLLGKTPVELEVRDRPTVNVQQTDSWIELRLRYLVHPKRGQQVRNELYSKLLSTFNENPDRVKFPLGRNR